MWRLPGLIESIQSAIERQDAATRPRAELDVELEQGSMDAELAQLRILLELADLIHGAEVDLPPRVLRNRRLVLKSSDTIPDPATERLVDAWPVRLKVGGDTGNSPPLGMKAKDRETSVCGIHLRVAGVPAADGGRLWSGCQHPFDGMRARAPT
jgi:hypothetical protein